MIVVAGPVPAIAVLTDQICAGTIPRSVENSFTGDIESR
jgi:hypothetical protein